MFRFYLAMIRTHEGFLKPPITLRATSKEAAREEIERAYPGAEVLSLEERPTAEMECFGHDEDDMSIREHLDFTWAPVPRE